MSRKSHYNHILDRECQAKNLIILKGRIGNVKNFTIIRGRIENAKKLTATKGMIDIAKKTSLLSNVG
jgi:hypothetical protein